MLLLLLLLLLIGALAILAASDPLPAGLAGWKAEKSPAKRAAVVAGWVHQVRTSQVGLPGMLPDSRQVATSDGASGVERRADAAQDEPTSASVEPARPQVPTDVHFATSPLGQELETVYLDYLRVRGEALLTFNPAPLREVLDGEALQEATDEILARQAADLPAQLVVRNYWLAFYRNRDNDPAILVQYLDETLPMDVQTGQAIRTTKPRPLVREIYTLHQTDEGWKVVSRIWERLGTVEVVQTSDKERLGPVDPTLDVARDYLREVLDEAWLTSDISRLGEILDETMVASLTRSLQNYEANGYAWKAAREHTFTAYLRYPDGTVRVEEVYINTGTWLDAETQLPLPSQAPPVLWSEAYKLQQIDGVWKVVDGWWSRKFGQAIR